MKRINELTHEELIALPEDQIQFYINLEIAEAGIKPCPVPVPPNVANAGIVANEVLYKVGSTLFKNKEDAIKVSQMETFTEQYDYNVSYDYKWADRSVDVRIDEVRLYKKEDVLRISSVLQDLKLKKNIYEEETRKFDKYQRSTTACRDSVWRIIVDARDKESRIINAQTAIENYKTLANGDQETALRFFEKAFTDEPQDIKEIALKRSGYSIAKPAESEAVAEPVL